MANRDDSAMPPVGDLEADEDEAREAEPPDAEPVSDDPKENLAAAARHLKTAVEKLGRSYSTAIIVGLALKGQSADNDYEIADCLKQQVTIQLWLSIYRLMRVARRLGVAIKNPMEASF